MQHSYAKKSFKNREFLMAVFARANLRLLIDAVINLLKCAHSARQIFFSQLLLIMGFKQKHVSTYFSRRSMIGPEKLKFEIASMILHFFNEITQIKSFFC